MTADDLLDAYPPMMTIGQVAEVVQVTPRTLFTWRRDGCGPPFTQLGDGRGGSIRYPREALRKYLIGRTMTRADRAPMAQR